MYNSIIFRNNAWHYQLVAGGMWYGGYPTFNAARIAAIQHSCH